MKSKSINDKSIIITITIAFSCFLIYILNSSFLDNYVGERDDGSGSSNIYTTYPILINQVNVVDIILNTSAGYSLSINNKIYFNKHGRSVCEANFLYFNQYSSHVKYAKSNKSVTILSENSNSDFEYVFYEDKYSYNYIVKINGLEYSFLLTSNISAEQASDCFNRIEFDVKKI